MAPVLLLLLLATCFSALNGFVETELLGVVEVAWHPPAKALSCLQKAREIQVMSQKAQLRNVVSLRRWRADHLP